MAYIAISLGFLLASAAATYAWWVRFRVWVLRQDLFEIRDRLWDRAATEGFLRDPQYREARAGINAMIRFAPRLCVPVWLYLEKIAHPRAVPERRILAVDEAMTQMGQRIFRYLYSQTMSGFFFAAWKAARHQPTKMETEAPQVRNVASSRELKDFEREYKRSQQRRFVTA